MFKNEIETISELINNFSSESNSGYQTLGLATIEYYLKELKSIVTVVLDTNAPRSKKEKKDKELLKKEIDKLKGDICYQYMRNFSVFDNNYIRANDISELLTAIVEVEKIFISKVNQAQNYFGKFLKKEFHFGINVSEMFEPHSIEEIINLTEKNKHDWSLYTIKSGRPQPLYKERFNLMLKEGINAYIDAYLF